MKRLPVIALAAALCAAGGAAHAGPKPAPKPKPKPKPVTMTFYFHGTQRLGEADYPPVASSGFGVMDATAPTGADSKSRQITNYVGGPNTECAGNSLFPVWIGTLNGDVLSAKVSFGAIGAPTSQVEIRLFQDVDAQACNDAFPKVVGSTTVALPTGQGKVEAALSNVKVKAKHSFMIEFSPRELNPDQGRVFYDSTADPSSITIVCLPPTGKKTC